MKFEKKVLCRLEECYSANAITVDGERRILLASEGHGPCYAFRGDDFARDTVWDAPGGTVAIIPVPGRNGEFLAVQRFFPVFQSEAAELVWVRPQSGGGYSVRPILLMPYLHRFDILSRGGVDYFLGATLCTSKTETEDWSDPGKVYAAVLPEDLDRPMEPQVLLDGQVKNHGYCRGTWKGQPAGFTASEQGVHAFVPPAAPGGSWIVEKILDRPVSDLAFCDIDGDGRDEIATIEPFHGKRFRIGRLEADGYRQLYERTGGMEFGHVVWGGRLRGQPVFLGGCRGLGREFFCIRWAVSGTSGFTEEIIESGAGPSNVVVLLGPDRDIIISANRESDEAVLYFVTD